MRANGISTRAHQVSILFACAALLLACDYTVAQALAGYTVVTAETALNIQPSKQLNVACPKGTKALGAGFGVLDSKSAILDGLATYSEPSYDGTSWLTNARKLSTFTSTWKLKVSVLCGSSKLAGYQVVVGETLANTTAKKQLAVACPVGKRATGAGFGVLDSTGVILDGEALHSMPRYDGSGWLTNARSNSTLSSSWKLRTRLVCVSSSALMGYQVVTQETAVNTALPKQLNVVCPGGKRVMGAGFGVLDSTSAILDGAALYSLPSYSGTSWLINAKNYSTSLSPAFKLRVNTLCAN